MFDLGLVPDGMVVSMGFLGGLLSVLKVIGPPILGSLLGRSSGGSQGGASAAETEQQRQLGLQSGIETEVLGNQRDIMNELLRLAGTFQGGPIGPLDIGDNPFLDEAKLGALEPRRDIDLLQSLLNVNLGRSATNQGAVLSQRQSENDADFRRDSGEGIAGIIGKVIELAQNRTGAVVDTGDATDVFQDIITSPLPPPVIGPFDQGNFGNRG